MINKHYLSRNILRDDQQDIYYIPTSNAKKVASQILNDIKNGIKTFSVVGSYGTGKSSFLLALQKNLMGSKNYFNISLNDNEQVRFLKLVGSYSSLIEVFKDYFSIKTKKEAIKDIFEELSNLSNKEKSKNQFLFIMIDEFGKHLEYASQNNPDVELYFFQELAEFCNDPDQNIVLITTIHQSFESYSNSLNSTQKHEWLKVKGRFREITFNEPIEQLIFLAAEHLTESNLSKNKSNDLDELLNIIKKSKAYNWNENDLESNSNRIYPLDLMSAYILALALQKYGQNERSLFSFLESTDHTGLNNFNNDKNPFYNISCVYDYLNYNFYSFLTSKYNPDFANWSSIRSSINDIERKFDESVDDLIKIIKTIGLLNIFIPSGADISITFLESYLKISNGIFNSAELLKQLEDRKIILYRNYAQRYVLFEGTDLDLQLALVEAGAKLTQTSDIPSLISKHYQFMPVFVKQYSFVNGTPRYFYDFNLN